ncbi:10300_t:CDS:1, partial [Acaulospora colombiana]
IQISNMISGLPPVHPMPHSAGAEGFSDLVHSPGQFTAPSYSAAEQPTPPPAKRPLKSALKVRKSAPEFIDTSLAWHDADARLPLPHGSNASSSSFNASSSSLDTGSLGSSFAGLHQAASHSQLSLLPDPHFSLPDSLQAQYAHQLRLLQEEYSQKAAKAERLRQRVAQRQSGMKGNVHQINTVLANIQIHDNPSHELLHVSPPSSGGGSGSGHRVSFDDGVEVIGMSTMDPSAYHDGS